MVHKTTWADVRRAKMNKYFHLIRQMPGVLGLSWKCFIGIFSIVYWHYMPLYLEQSYLDPRYRALAMLEATMTNQLRLQKKKLESTGILIEGRTDYCLLPGYLLAIRLCRV